MRGPMDKLLTADDVAEVLQVSRRTAYKIMHEMPHMESPFRVAEATRQEPALLV